MRSKRRVQVRVSAPQAEFVEAPFPKVFVGGVGVGKTTVGVITSLKMPPNTRGLVIAPTYPMLRDVIAQAYLTIAEPLIVSYNRSTLELTLRGGRAILLRSAHYPERLRGLDIDWAWIDEATYVPEEVWQVMLARLRRNPHQWYLTCTPLRPSWVYDRLIAEPQTQVSIITAPSTQNPFLPAEYVQSLERYYGSSYARREVYAEWIQLDTGLVRAESIAIKDNLLGQQDTTVVIGVDLASALHEDADYTACVVVRYGMGRYQVEDAQRGRWTFREQIDRILTLAEQYQASRVRVEANAYQSVLAQELAHALVAVEPVKVSKAKKERFAIFPALYEMGLITHTRRLRDLEAELTSFPNCEHDDLLDALYHAITAFQPIAHPQTIDPAQLTLKRRSPL